MRASSKDKILMAAAKTFLKKGLEATTMADISKAAHLTQPAVYVYFKNKMDLMKAVCLWSAERGRTFIDQNILDTDPAAKRFESYVSANLNFFKLEEMHAHSIMAIYYFSLTNPEIKAVFKTVQDVGLKRIELFIINGNYEGSWRVENIPLVAQMVHSLLIGECYKVIYSVEQCDLSEFSKETWLAILKLIRG